MSKVKLHNEQDTENKWTFLQMSSIKAENILFGFKYKSGFIQTHSPDNNLHASKWWQHCELKTIQYDKPVCPIL